MDVYPEFKNEQILNLSEISFLVILTYRHQIIRKIFFESSEGNLNADINNW